MAEPTGGRCFDVSVVIAAWNAESSLVEAIESALAQDGVTVEVIIVNDASQDATGALVDRLAAVDKHVIGIHLPTNSGPAAARNRAFDCARGRWIAVLDSDDAFVPGRLRRLVAIGEASAADVVVDNLGAVDGQSGTNPPMFSRAEFVASDSFSLERFIARNTPFKQRFTLGYVKPVFRRAFLEERRLRYDPELRIGEDYLLMADALACGAICAVEPEPGYLYRTRAGSLSRVLESEHLSAMRLADEAFARRHALPKSALRALADRRRALENALAFVRAVEHIKRRQFSAAAAELARRPAAGLLFHLPIAERFRRLLSSLRPQQPEAASPSSGGSRP